MLILTSLNAQVGIGNTTPEGALDITSTTNGFVPPRVALTDTSVEAPIVNPQGGSIPAGTIVWNTATGGVSPNNVAPGLYYWNGSRWVGFAGSPGGLDWSLTGNSGTNTSTNFVGTTDANGLVIATDNASRFIITTNNSIHAYSDGSAAQPVFSWNSDSDIGIYRAGVNQLAFATDGNERMKINGTQVLINTSGDTQSQLKVVNNVPGTDQRAIQGSNSADGSGVFGSNTSTGNGVWGRNLGTGNGIYGLNNSSGNGVYGRNTGPGGGYGVKGESTGGGTGVYGVTDNNNDYGVWGYNSDSTGFPVGVYGVTDAATGYGVLGENTAYSAGGTNEYGVYSNGDLGASGTKTFRIDHPLDPENKYLRHFSVESNEVLNIYRGVVSFDAEGNAKVVLPTYFEALNINSSYQLTPVGASMPDIYISQEIKENIFVISGGISGKKVSWQITAQRNDAYMQTKDLEVEVEKGDNEKGKYLIPELYNQPKEKGIFYREK